MHLLAREATPSGEAQAREEGPGAIDSIVPDRDNVLSIVPEEGAPQALLPRPRIIDPLSPKALESLPSKRSMPAILAHLSVPSTSEVALRCRSATSARIMCGRTLEFRLP